MRKLALPELEAGPTFLTCISRVQNAALKARLISIEPHIIQAESDYRNAAQAKVLHTIAPQDHVNGVVTNAEMVAIYDNRMAKSGSPGRSTYDQLKAVPPLNRCPFCNQRTVSTLDHHLTKSRYSALAVMPINLVACCEACNKLKHNDIPTTAEEVYLHPYFDDIEDHQWLYADVHHINPVSLTFYVKAPEQWDYVLVARVKNHFNKLNLDALYRSHSAEEILNMRHQLNELFLAGGQPAVRAHLLQAYQSRLHAQKNSWQTAMYQSISNDDWFTNGGFNEL